MPVYEYLDHSRERFPEKVALVCDTERTTYEDLGRFSDSLAAYLAECGITRGDRVLIFLENSKETVVSIFGALKAGACMVLVNPTTPPEHLRFITIDCGCKMLISNISRLPTIDEAFVNLNAPPRLLLSGDNSRPSLQDALSFSPSKRTAQIGDSDLAAIIYTSGSTGNPKGVTLTHRNIDVVVRSVSEYLEHSDNDIVLCVLQLSFGYGLLQLLVTFHSGGRLVLEKGFGFPYDIIKRILREKVTGLAGVPTLFSILLQLKELEQEDFSSVRYLTNAAAALPPSYVPRLKSVFKQARLFLMHGQTECLRTTYLPPDEAERRPTSVGKGMPNVELWLEDEKGNRIAGEGEGELIVRGLNVMRGYWNDAETTSRVLRPSSDGHMALHTGDLFRVDGEGYLYFVARRDDIIKSRGQKVSPLEIEQILFSLDEVAEARVLGVPDEILGQAIKAEIVLKKGRLLSERQIKAFCKTHLEDYKIPHIIEFVSSLPKTAGGKVKRSPA